MSATLAKATAPKKQRSQLLPGDVQFGDTQGKHALQNDLSPLHDPADLIKKKNQALSGKHQGQLFSASALLTK